MNTPQTPHSPCGCQAPAPSHPSAAKSPAHAHAHGKGSHEHEHEHGDAHHGHDHGQLPGWPRISLALVLALLSEVLHWVAPQQPLWHYTGMVLAAAAIALAGLGIYAMGLRSLLRLQLGIHALMAVAVTGAFAIGQWPEAAMVMALYAAAERIEDQAFDRARQAIRGLLQLAPDQVTVVQPDGSTTEQATAQVALGARIVVAPGARIPLDGEVLAGHSSVNQAPITGESMPVEKAPGDTVWAGSINLHAALQLQVTATHDQSLLTRIVQAVEQAQAQQAPTQRFVDRFAAIYTPIVLVLAILLAVLAPLLTSWTWMEALYQALALLVIACPCALVLSTPVTVVSALTAAARQGVLLKGGAALEAARQLHTVALDKTGTLTTGQPSLVQWQWLAAPPSATGDARGHAAGDSPSTAVAELSHAYALAAASPHPVSQAIAQGLATEVPATARTLAVQQLTALPGFGVQAQVEQHPLALVNLRWLQEHLLETPALRSAIDAQTRQGRSVSVLVLGQQVLAWFAVADCLRPEAAEAVAQLQAMGVQTVMLSGDHPDAVQAMAQQAGITLAYGGLLPQEKLDHLRQLQSAGRVAMVGDGINDAPALAQAELGIAMGGAHSTDLAMETADVVLMHDDLRRIPSTLALAQRAHRVLWQNIGLALGIKLAFFGLALSGHASMWLAVLADMGVSLLVVANGLRLRRKTGNK